MEKKSSKEEGGIGLYAVLDCYCFDIELSVLPILFQYNNNDQKNGSLPWTSIYVSYGREKKKGGDQKNTELYRFRN